MSDERVRLRRRLRALRAQLDAGTRRAAAVAVARRLARDPAFRRSRNVALYAATGAELSVWPLAALCLAANKRVFLPRIRHRGMEFAAWHPARPLRRGAYGIAEPGRDRPRAWRTRLDVVIVPLLGFDAGGNRIGQGGGYYDRTFAAHATARWRHTQLFGVAFEIQRCATVHPQPWDVPLDKIFTDKRRYAERRHTLSWAVDESRDSPSPET